VLVEQAELVHQGGPMVQIRFLVQSHQLAAVKVECKRAMLVHQVVLVAAVVAVTELVFKLTPLEQELHLQFKVIAVVMVAMILEQPLVVLVEVVLALLEVIIVPQVGEMVEVVFHPQSQVRQFFVAVVAAAL
jgi:hypothetical protein